MDGPLQLQPATKEKYDRLKAKYGYLWSQLENDPLVLKEYQTLLQISRSKLASSQSNEEILHVESQQEGSNGARALNPSPTVLCNITNSAQRQNNTPALLLETKRDKIDFLSAIENRQTVQIQVGVCCDFDGCQGCADPILEFDDDNEVQEEEEQTVVEEEQTVLANFNQVRDQSAHRDKSLSFSGDSSNANNLSTSSSSSSGGSTVMFDLSHLVQENYCDSSLRSDDCATEEKCDQEHMMDQTLDQGEVADDELELEPEDMTKSGRNDVDGLDTFFQKFSIGQEETEERELFQSSPCISPILGNEVHGNGGEDDIMDRSVGTDTDVPVARVIFQRAMSESPLQSFPWRDETDHDSAFIDRDTNESKSTAKFLSNDSNDGNDSVDREDGNSSNVDATSLSFQDDRLEQKRAEKGVTGDSSIDSESSSSASSGSSSSSGSVRFTLDPKSFISAGIVIGSDCEVDGNESEAKDGSRSRLSFEAEEENKVNDGQADVFSEEATHSKPRSQNESRSSEEVEWSDNDSTEDKPVNQKSSFTNEVIIVDDSDEISYDESSGESDIDNSIELSEEGANEESNHSRDKYSESDTSSDDSVLRGTQIDATKDLSPRNRKPPMTKPSTEICVREDSDSFHIRQSTHKIKKSKPVNFKSNREIITKEAFREFNTRIFKTALGGVEVQWSARLTKTAGLTRLKKRGKEGSMAKTASIELSTKLIDNEERLRSTLCHEMCHAAQWLVDGVAKPPHGTCFKKWADLSMRKVR
jgi:hypothetical protein